MALYIPTRSRAHMLVRTVPRWLEQEQIGTIRLVVPASEYKATARLRDEHDWEVAVVSLPHGSRGISASRAFCVEHAGRQGYEAIIMSDDDYRPQRTSDASGLLRAAEDRYALGVGAVRSLHDRFNGGRLSALSGPILCPGGWGFQCFALNVRNALAVGNFDPELAFWEDAELARNGIDNGLPWRVHCDVWIDSMQKRDSAGGMSSLFRSREERDEAEQRSLRLIESRWPKYQVRGPSGKSRMLWQKMLDDYLPAWRGLSALHGGSL